MAQADSVTAIAEWTGDVPAEALQALGGPQAPAGPALKERIHGTRYYG